MSKRNGKLVGWGVGFIAMLIVGWTAFNSNHTIGTAADLAEHKTDNARTDERVKAVQAIVGEIKETNEKILGVQQDILIEIARDTP